MSNERRAPDRRDLAGERGETSHGETESAEADSDSVTARVFAFAFDSDVRIDER
jgi:hypothetical protein